LRAISIAALCAILAGCAPSAEQRLQQTWSQRQLDDDKCRSYGAKDGDPAYVQCRAQLDAARTGAQATAAAASTAAAATIAATPIIIQPRR
jgi:outer membrane biogenesis lipoprotein LolB